VSFNSVEYVRPVTHLNFVITLTHLLFKMRFVGGFMLSGVLRRRGYYVVEGIMSSGVLCRRGYYAVEGIMPSRMVNSCRLSDLPDPQDGGTTVLRNYGKCLPVDIM
jgi:hypothetical protein